MGVAVSIPVTDYIIVPEKSMHVLALGEIYQSFRLLDS